jgi:protein phosphatase
MLDLEHAALSDKGRVRSNNEDAVGHVAPSSAAMVQSQGWFFCMADGMGGHDKGEVAAQLAVSTAVEGFRHIPKGVMHVSLLPRLVQAANAAVYDAGQSQTPGARMGCTFVACALRFDSAVISHVGDSRCYLMRSGTLTQLTHDHTMANEQVRLGILTSEDAGSGDGRHLLTRALGSELFVAADTITVNILPGDVLMLSTDGLHGYVSEDQIRYILNGEGKLDGTAQALIDAANATGGADNASVQLIRVRNVERMGLYRGRPYRLL